MDDSSPSSVPSVEAIVARVLESETFVEVGRNVLTELKRAGDTAHLEDDVQKGKSLIALAWSVFLTKKK